MVYEVVLDQKRIKTTARLLYPNHNKTTKINYPGLAQDFMTTVVSLHVHRSQTHVCAFFIFIFLQLRSVIWLRGCFWQWTNAFMSGCMFCLYCASVGKDAYTCNAVCGTFLLINTRTCKDLEEDCRPANMHANIHNLTFFKRNFASDYKRIILYNVFAKTLIGIASLFSNGTYILAVRSVTSANLFRAGFHK